MPEHKKALIKSLFQNIKDYLKKKEDGSYIFKNNTYQFSSSIGIDPYMSNDEFSDIPSKEELCQFFEKEILSIIPHASLFINDNLSISVNIEKNPEFLRKIYLAKKELEVYESIKTLFFPTMKEFMVKFGNSHPELIYSPSRKFIVEIYNINGDIKRQGIRFKSPYSRIIRPINNAAINFLIEDINYYISNLKFRNPIPRYAIKLPQKDITIEKLKSQTERTRKGFYISEFYSYNQKIKFLNELFKNFMEYYQYIINNNFSRIKNAFPLFNELPIKISIYTKKKTVDSLPNLEDISFTCIFERLPQDSSNQVELKENQEFNDDPYKYLRCESTLFTSLLVISHFGGFNFRGMFSTSQFQNPYNAQRNALTYTYQYIREELDEILEKIQSDSIFDEINPYMSSADSWVQIILEAEKRGNEDYYIELKRIPSESPNRNGSGNDIYGQINAFENGDGGYLFIGVDENKKKLEKIVGLESYFRDHNKNLDMVKREIIDKCIKYLGKTYRIDSDLYEGKSLIRVKVSSNYGSVSWFKPETGNPCAYIRENGKKRTMSPREIERRFRGKK